MNDNVNVVNLIGSVMIPLLALIISVSLYRRGISQTVVDFFAQGDSTEQGAQGTVLCVDEKSIM